MLQGKGESTQRQPTLKSCVPGIHVKTKALTEFLQSNSKKDSRKKNKSKQIYQKDQVLQFQKNEQRAESPGQANQKLVQEKLFSISQGPAQTPLKDMQSLTKENQSAQGQQERNFEDIRQTLQRKQSHPSPSQIVASLKSIQQDCKLTNQASRVLSDVTNTTFRSSPVQKQFQIQANTQNAQAQQFQVLQMQNSNQYQSQDLFFASRPQVPNTLAQLTAQQPPSQPIFSTPLQKPRFNTPLPSKSLNIQQTYSQGVQKKKDYLSPEEKLCALSLISLSKDRNKLRK